MAAKIISKVNGISPVTAASRDDLRSADVVSVEHDTAAEPGFTTIAWSLEYAPQDPDQTPSVAVLSGTTGPGPHTFTIDNDGAYQIKETVDAGLPSESIQFVRLRALTQFGQLTLVSAGEKRDETGVIPVDVSLEGWADEQNYNVNTLLGLVQHVSSSGRIIYVDANRGKDYSNTPNDFANNGNIEDYGDFFTIQQAINISIDPSPTNPFTGGVLPSADNPIIIAVRPGLYVEDLELQPYVNIIAWPSMGIGDTSLNLVGDKTVLVQNANLAGTGTHTANLQNPLHFSHVRGIHFVNTAETTNAVWRKTGQGALYFEDCRITQNGDGTAPLGACMSVEQGLAQLTGCYFVQQTVGDPTAVAITLNPQNPNSGILIAKNCDFRGPSAASLNPLFANSAQAVFANCKFTQVGSDVSSFCVDTWAPSARFTRCELFLGNSNDNSLRINPDQTGTSGSYFALFEFCNTSKDLLIDGTNVIGDATLELCSSAFDEVNEVGTVIVTACTQAQSIVYLGDTLDDILNTLILNSTVIEGLDDAYDGFDYSGTAPLRLTGAGKRIIADQGGVEIIRGGNPVTDPITPFDGTSNGGLKMVGALEIGAFDAPEILASPNFFALGPSIRGGQTVWPNGNPLGGDFAIISNATGDPLFLNYGMSLQSKSTVGNSSASNVGRVFVKGGDALAGSGAQAPDGAQVYVEAGNVFETVAGAPGNIWLAPGHALFGPTSGTLKLVDQSGSTPATLAAASAVGGAALGVQGNITFAVHNGTVTIPVFLTDTIASLVTLITTTLEDFEGLGNAVDLGGGQLQLTSAATGPNAQVFFISDDQGGVINTALGDFSLPSASFTAGTHATFVDIRTSGTQEITIGDGTNDMVYNAVTGKLTIPGLIDPTGVIFDEIGEAAITTGAGKGGIFVSDGTGGAPAAGNIWYKDPVGTLTDLTAAGGGGGAPVGAPYLLATANGTLTGSRVTLGITNEIAIVDGGAGANFDIGLADFGPGAGGPFTNATVSIDIKGRVTAIASGATAVSQHQFTKSLLVATNAGANTVKEFEVIAFTGGLTTGAEVKIYLTSSISSGAAVNLAINVGPHGSLVSYMTNQDVTLLSAGVTTIAVSGSALSQDDIIEISLTNTNDITAGDGLYVTVTGTG